MIPHNITDHILTLSIDHKYPKGGIAQVVNSYSQIFETFNFIATTNTGNFISRQIIGIIAIFKLIKKLCGKKIKIVHIHCASGKSFYRKSVYILICKLFNVRILCHMHSGHMVHFTKKHPKFVKRILNLCDNVIVLSRTWKTFYKNFGFSNVTIIDNIVSYPQYIPCKKDNRLHIVYLGTLTPMKGFYDLLQAIGDYKKDFESKVLFHIGGLGDLDYFNQEIERLGISDLINYHGFVAGEEKCRLFSMCNVFILPSYFEGLPISILEAMAYGLPIIATQVGAIPELVTTGKNGILITPGHIDEIGLAIKQLLNNPDMRQDMGEVSKHKSLNFLPEHIEKELTDLYLQYL